MIPLRDPDDCRVAAVLGNTVRIYGKSDDGFRPYTGEKHVFPTYGKALEFAIEYDLKERTRVVKSAA